MGDLIVPGPLASRSSKRPNLKITARSYSGTTCKEEKWKLISVCVCVCVQSDLDQKYERKWEE